MNPIKLFWIKNVGKVAQFSHIMLFLVYMEASLFCNNPHHNVLLHYLYALCPKISQTTVQP